MKGGDNAISFENFHLSKVFFNHAEDMALYNIMSSETTYDDCLTVTLIYWTSLKLQPSDVSGSFSTNLVKCLV